MNNLKGLKRLLRIFGAPIIVFPPQWCMYIIRNYMVCSHILMTGNNSRVCAYRVDYIQTWFIYCIFKVLTNKQNMETYWLTQVKFLIEAWDFNKLLIGKVFVQLTLFSNNRNRIKGKVIKLIRLHIYHKI